jgi:integrase
MAVECRRPINVRFTPKSGHWDSAARCPLCAKGGCCACFLIRCAPLPKVSCNLNEADDLLFPRWDNGKVRSPHWLTQKFALLMEALKIKGVTFHSLRHTHASQLIASGTDVLTISRRLGHGSPAITLSVYGHMFTNADARAAEITEGMFTGLRTD